MAHAMVMMAWIVGMGASPALAQAPPAIALPDYPALYASLHAGVVKIHADDRSGSGFLVSPDGLIATNHHVVRRSRYLAVEFADGRKVRAAAVLLDPHFDVALLQVNRALVGALRPLDLLPAADEAQVAAGIEVLAFGSPLSQTAMMTRGILSKAEPDVLLGDFLVQSGSSGGPLVNRRGQVLGITTFAEGRISGAVRAARVRDALAKLEAQGRAAADPAADLLPTASPSRYPTDVLRQRILAEPLDPAAYRIDGGRFTITVMTPVHAAKAHAVVERAQAANRQTRRGMSGVGPADTFDEPYYDWYRNTSALDLLVTFEIEPGIGSKTRSRWARLAARVSGALLGTPHAPARHVEYTSEFEDCRLYRDGVLVPPVHPGRSLAEAAVSDPAMEFVDEASSGAYAYAPEVFMTGSQFRLEVFDARAPDRPDRVVVLPAESAVIQQIRRDFAGALGPGR
jgi:hypothetical protein